MTLVHFSYTFAVNYKTSLWWHSLLIAQIVTELSLHSSEWTRLYKYKNMPQRAAFWLGLSVWRNQGTLHQSLRGGAFGRGRALKALQLCSLRFHPHALHQCSWLKEFTNAAGGKWRLKPDAATTTFSHEDSKLPQENEWKSLSDCKRRKILDTVQLDAKWCAHCPDPGGSRQSSWSGSSAIPKSSVWCRHVWYTQWPGEAFGPVIMGHVSVRQHETYSDIKLEKDCMTAVITNLWNYH